MIFSGALPLRLERSACERVCKGISLWRMEEERAFGEAKRLSPKEQSTEYCFRWLAKRREIDRDGNVVVVVVLHAMRNQLWSDA